MTNKFHSHRMGLLPLFAALIVFQSCSDKSPKPDLSQPESTIKSFWTLQDFESERTLRQGLADKTWDCFYDANALSILKGHTRQSIDQYKIPPVRTIEKIDLETPTRAIATTEEQRYPDDKHSQKHRYVLTRRGAVWLIENHFEQCPICDGLGYDKYDEKRAKCKYCNGTGFQSDIYETKPIDN
jgi:hypothetical protein